MINRSGLKQNTFISQISRIIRPEMIQISRFYGSYRNLHSHYKTLRIAPNATQKDIRQAFIKLSKEMHPDLSKKSSHADFVKVNEAYKVLSKERTRQMHDIELRNGGPYGRPIRVVHYNPTEKEWYARYGIHYHPYDGENQAAKRFPNLTKTTIVLLCILLTSFGMGFQVLAALKSSSFRDKALAESAHYTTIYNQIRSEARAKDHKERLIEVEKRLRTDSDDAKVEVQS